jgi:hypothetical protein
MEVDVDSIAKHLRESAVEIENLEAEKTPGVYAYFLTETKTLGSFPVEADGLIYVGLSSNLARREFDNHFNSKSTGGSTLRRSFGAILKEQLGLTAIPRGSGKSKKDFENFRFRPEGEEKLTHWMRSNLKVGVYPVDKPGSWEDELIPLLKPLLNLNKWPNPNRARIMALRKICAEEARSNQ